MRHTGSGKGRAGTGQYCRQPAETNPGCPAVPTPTRGCQGPLNVHIGTTEVYLEPAAPSGSIEGRAMRIFVANLPFTTTEEELSHLFASDGRVEHAQININRATGRSRAYRFVEMPDAT